MLPVVGMQHELDVRALFAVVEQDEVGPPSAPPQAVDVRGDRHPQRRLGFEAGIDVEYLEAVPEGVVEEPVHQFEVPAADIGAADELRRGRIRDGENVQPVGIRGPDVRDVSVDEHRAGKRDQVVAADQHGAGRIAEVVRRETS